VLSLYQSAIQALLSLYQGATKALFKRYSSDIQAQFKHYQGAYLDDIFGHSHAFVRSCSAFIKALFRRYQASI
jgi:hypothetical protein